MQKYSTHKVVNTGKIILIEASPFDKESTCWVNKSTNDDYDEYLESEYLFDTLPEAVNAGILILKKVIQHQKSKLNTFNTNLESLFNSYAEVFEDSNCDEDTAQ